MKKNAKKVYKRKWNEESGRVYVEKKKDMSSWKKRNEEKREGKVKEKEKEIKYKRKRSRKEESRENEQEWI